MLRLNNCRLLVISFASLFLTACLDSTGPNPNDVAQVLIVAPSRQMIVGETMQLSGRAATYSAERVDHLVTWESANTDVLTVSSTGLVTAVAVGATDIIARAQDKSHSVLINVNPPPP